MFGKDYVDIDDIISTHLEPYLLTERLLHLIDIDHEHKEEFLKTSEWLLDHLGKSHALAAGEETYAKMHIETGALILNWGLVILWATFEAWLEDLLLLFWKVRPESFQSWAGEKNFPYKEVMEHEDLKSLRDTMYRNALRDFTSKSIAYRFKDLEKKLGIPLDYFCSEDHNPFDHSLDLGWTIDNLTIISNQRNDIVHNRKMPLITLEELNTIHLGLTNVVVNLACAIAIKGKIRCTWIKDE